MQRFSGLFTPVIMFLLLLFSGHQGYVVLKNYKKVDDKLNETAEASSPSQTERNEFALFQPAVQQRVAQAVVKQPLNAEVEGIINSDEPWLSFAMVKTPAGIQSYREGESLTGFSDAWIEEINSDNVVINYQGAEQKLALKRPDYFKGDVGNKPLPRPATDAGLDNIHLNDVLVLKPYIDRGQLEGYQINPRNASTWFHDVGLEKGDLVVKVNSVDMTKEEQAKNILPSWSKLREAEVVVKRHAHLENIRVNVLNN
jgi:general secretion pathway protein C